MSSFDEKQKVTVRIPSGRVQRVDKVTKHLQTVFRSKYAGRPLRFRKEDLHDLALEALLKRPLKDIEELANDYLRRLYRA